MKLALIIIFLFSFQSSAHDHICELPLTDEAFSTIVAEVRAAYFSDLSELHIPIRHFHQTAYYLQASVNQTKLLIGKKRYHLDVNPDLLQCPPSNEGLRAILVHEFEHFRDYHRRSAAQVAQLGLKYAASRKFRARYERRTDEKVLRQHLAVGLREYRLWLYQWLTPKQLVRKQYLYFTPTEIDQWNDQQASTVMHTSGVF